MAVCQKNILPIWPTQIKCIFLCLKSYSLYGVKKMAVCQKTILPIWPTQISVSLLCLKTMPVWYLTKMATISKIIYGMKNNKPPM